MADVEGSILARDSVIGRDTSTLDLPTILVESPRLLVEGTPISPSMTDFGSLSIDSKSIVAVSPVAAESMAHVDTGCGCSVIELPNIVKPIQQPTPDADTGTKSISFLGLPVVSTAATRPDVRHFPQPSASFLSLPAPLDLTMRDESIIEMPAMNKTLTDQELLRGMSAFHALSGCGHIFQKSAGSAKTWKLSSPVGRIRWFISHNWSVRRLEKFAVLALHFNLLPAVLITCLAMLFVLVLTAAGQLPLEDVLDEDGIDTTKTGICARATATVLFLVVLFTWHEIGGRIGLMQTPVFLDKSCISQTNVQLKQKGVSSLAAFLGHSDGMLVVYTDVYLRKMWTVYELACTLILYPDMRVTVVPTFLPKFLVVGSFLAYIYYLVQFVWFWKDTHDALSNNLISSFATGTPSLLREVCFCVFVRVKARNEQRIQRAAERFHISDAACYDEKDRHLVCSSVMHFMRSSGRVPAQATRKESLSAFDELVRREVPRFLIRSLGERGGVPYHIIVIVFLPLTGILVDRAGAAISAGESVWLVLEIIMRCLALQFLCLPSLVQMASLSMHRCIHLRGCAECAFVGSIALLLSAATWVAGEVINHLTVWTYSVLFLVLTCLLYRPWGDFLANIHVSTAPAECK